MDVVERFLYMDYGQSEGAYIEKCVPSVGIGRCIRDLKLSAF